jgi:Skp family chaperone for outer membrane proteins
MESPQIQLLLSICFDFELSNEKESIKDWAEFSTYFQCDRKLREMELLALQKEHENFVKEIEIARLNVKNLDHKLKSKDFLNEILNAYKRLQQNPLENQNEINNKIDEVSKEIQHLEKVLTFKRSFILVLLFRRKFLRKVR